MGFFNTNLVQFKRKLPNWPYLRLKIVFDTGKYNAIVILSTVSNYWHNRTEFLACRKFSVGPFFQNHSGYFNRSFQKYLHRVKFIPQPYILQTSWDSPNSLQLMPFHCSPLCMSLLSRRYTRFCSNGYTQTDLGFFSGRTIRPSLFAIQFVT